MAMRYPETVKDEQWKQVSELVQLEVMHEYRKLEVTRAQQQKDRERVMRKFPCLLMPELVAPNKSKP